MRLLHRPAPPCPEIGQGLYARIARLQDPPRVHRLRWRWMLGWWDHRRKPKRRGTPVA